MRGLISILFMLGSILRFRILLIAFVSQFFLLGCTRHETLVISGNLEDPNQGIPVGGATVELWTQRIEAGIFRANYDLAGTRITDTGGRFSFEMDYRNYTGLKLIFAKAGYYGWTLELNTEEVKSEGGVDARYQILPKAVLQIHVLNAQPANEQDYFEFRLLNGFTSCEVCCKSEMYQFSGMTIDQEVLCQIIGHQNILIRWSKRKNDEQVFRTDTFFIKAFDTTRIELIY